MPTNLHLKKTKKCLIHETVVPFLACTAPTRWKPTDTKVMATSMNCDPASRGERPKEWRVERSSVRRADTSDGPTKQTNCLEKKSIVNFKHF